MKHSEQIIEVEMNATKQHSILQSVLYHLVPGVLVLVLLLVFSNPFFAKSFGFNVRLAPFVGYLFSLLIGVILAQIGLLLFAAKSETGKFDLRGVVKYTEKSPIKQYLLYVPVMILYYILLFLVVAPILQPYLIDTFFQWWPEKYNFQLVLQDPSTLVGYSGVKFLAIVYLLLSCICGPLVEELYFRGYLLPRMDNAAGKWAPLLNTILFSLYHFFSPWENLVRIVAGYPMVYLVWKKRDIRFGIFVHILVNSIGGIFILVMIF